MAPFNVGFVHQSFADYTAGLTSALKQSVPLTVTCVASGEASPGLTDSASEVLRCRRFRHPLSPYSARHSISVIADQYNDLVHWQAAGNPWVDLAALRLFSAVPTVLTIHDMVPHPGDSTALPGTFAAIRLLARRAGHVIVHAEVVKEQVIRVGVPPLNVSVVPHGELASLYSPAASTSAVPNRPTVLFFGRAQQYKGLEVVMKAMEQVAVRVPEAKLVVAGDGPELRSLKEARPPSWLDLRPGFVERSEVPGLFNDSSVVVLPYIEASQSGVAALAIGFGKAVVASAVGGLVEMVDHRQTGVLVRPGDVDALADGLVDVLVDHEIRARYEANAHTVAASRLSWPRIAAQTVEIYRRVAQR